MKKIYSISIDKEVHDKIMQLAIKEKRSFSNMVEKILAEYREQK